MAQGKRSPRYLHQQCSDGRLMVFNEENGDEYIKTDTHINREEML